MLSKMKVVLQLMICAVCVLLILVGVYWQSFLFNTTEFFRTEEEFKVFTVHQNIIFTEEVTTTDKEFYFFSTGAMSTEDWMTASSQSSLPTQTSFTTTGEEDATETTGLEDDVTTTTQEENYVTTNTNEEYDSTTISSSYYEKFTAERFKKRFEQMHKHCRIKRPISSFFIPNENILVNENHNLEICVVPKSGSTSWHFLIFKLRLLDEGKPLDTRYSPEVTPFNHKTSQRIINREKFNKWQNGVDDDFFTEPNPQRVYRIITGRHPFARLISAWHQKMMTAIPSPIYQQFFQLYPDMMSYNKTEHDQSHAMSWEDFAEYVSEIRKYGWAMDYHFVPAAELCKQCNYFFTYVVKLETMDEDYDWLAKRIHLPSNVQLGRVGTPPNGSLVNSNPGEKVTQYMKRLRHDIVARLYKLYEQDFNDFGYTFDLKTYEAGGFD